ncbi:MAG: SDR family oxidoreductase [Ignavibacteriae bacterium]|nr:SDR family oxidoreductase [Ignavibacteriota bacterium]MCB9220942.1 SDR family oxidoreductase [Ignavibacteria bacterium]
MIRNIYVFGATSKIAEETIKHFAKESANFYLVGRDIDKLGIVSKDLLARGANKVELETCNALDWEKHPATVDKADNSIGQLDLIFIAHGTLPVNEDIRNNQMKVIEEFNINCTSIISLCTVASDYFEKKGKGTIAVISSVAGERGRQSNFIYGSAKGGVTKYLEGLRNRLFEKGIKVITIKPGMVDTPMTKDFKKGLLFASPSRVGKEIYKGIKIGRDVMYVPGYWKIIMGIIKSIPESIFKKLKL